MRKLLLLIFVIYPIIVFAQRAGDFDSTFGVNGLLRLKTCLPFGMKVYPDGRIIVAGSDNFSLCRFLKNGTPDSSFLGTGEAHYSPDTPSFDQIAAILLTPTNKIIVSGIMVTKTGIDLCIARFKNDGTVDSAFANNGIFLSGLPLDDYSAAIALQSNGSIISGGWIQDSVIGYKYLIVRIDSNGVYDSSFSNNGVVITSLDTTNIAEGGGIAIQDDGRIVVAGCTGNKLAVVRYNYNGSLDTNFAMGGIKLFPAVNLRYPSGSAVLLQKDGKIILGGYGAFDTTTDLDFVARLNLNGSLDTSFANNGIAIIDFGQENLLTSIDIQSDGKIILSGFLEPVFSGFVNQFTTARLNVNGLIDSTFGDNGLVINTLSYYQFDRAFCSAIQPDGKLLVAGISRDTAAPYIIVRYLTEIKLGLLDFKNSISNPIVYPNPVNEESSLEYEISSSENISITLYNTVGELVKVFVTNEMEQKGKHYIKLPFNNLPNGMYTLQINSGNGNSFVKLIKANY